MAVVRRRTTALAPWPGWKPRSASRAAAESTLAPASRASRARARAPQGGGCEPGAPRQPSQPRRRTLLEAAPGLRHGVAEEGEGGQVLQRAEHGRDTGHVGEVGDTPASVPGTRRPSKGWPWDRPEVAPDERGDEERPHT